MFEDNFKQAAKENINKYKSSYSNAVFLNRSSNGSEPEMPFIAYKQPGYIFTDWRSSGASNAMNMQSFNLPSNSNLYRQAMTDGGVAVKNDELIAWTYRTQTLTNNGSLLSCTTDADCAPWAGTTCNHNVEGWESSQGNQVGSYCSHTVYPELEAEYNRKYSKDGGIGKSCSTDNDCGDGYSCNNKTNIFGSAVQATGYCSQTYSCPDGSTHYLGYPYNSSVPIEPPMNQNNNGTGYDSFDECNDSMLPQQKCVNKDGRWFATYPGYCPISSIYRTDGKSGDVRTSSSMDVSKGFAIPSYGNSLSSSADGNSYQRSFPGWNIFQDLDESDDMQSASNYATRVNPTPGNIL